MFLSRKFRTSIKENILKRILFYYLKTYQKKSNLKAVFTNDVIGNKILIDGIYEGGLLEDLKFLLEKLEIDCSREIVLDIGANIGNYSIFFATFYKTVHSFEPHPDTFELLQFNVRNKNIITHNIGIGSKFEEIFLNENTENRGASSIVHNSTSINKIKISIKPLDEYFLGIEKIGLIKIDVEGYENEVLLGSKNIILKNRPIIMIEQLKDQFQNGTTYSIEFIKEMGYTIVYPEIKHLKNQNILFKMMRLLQSSHTNNYLRGESIPAMDYSALFCIPNELF